MGGSDAATREVSIVLPCLNEADTLEHCLTKALRALRQERVDGELIVADNGSTDGSQDIARRCGARLVTVPARGYGSALMGGIDAALGRYIIIGDADDSYDFLEVPKFVAKLREGYDLVQGCRLPAGGGRVMPRAMPFTHRWIGNPLFSRLSRWWFKTPVHDVYCGMRGFSKAYYESLHQQCTGMEFATEMIVKSSLYGGRITEVPITLHPDGRRSNPSHVRTLRDGWRTLRFLLMYCPRWLFLMPGAFLIVLGLIGWGLALPGVPSALSSQPRASVATILFSVLAVVLVLVGSEVLAAAESAAHEIEAFILFLIAAVFLGGHGRLQAPPTGGADVVRA